MLVQAVVDGVAAFGEEGCAQHVADWLDSRDRHSSYGLSLRIIKAMQARAVPDPVVVTPPPVDLDGEP